MFFFYIIFQNEIKIIFIKLFRWFKAFNNNMILLPIVTDFFFNLNIAVSLTSLILISNLFSANKYSTKMLLAGENLFFFCYVTFGARDGVHYLVFNC